MFAFFMLRRIADNTRRNGQAAEPKPYVRPGWSRGKWGDRLAVAGIFGLILLIKLAAG